MQNKLGVLMALVLVVAACTGSSNYWVTYAPLNGKSAVPKAALVQKAVIAITDAGKEIESSDGTSGIVLSKWFQGDGMMSDDNRFRVRVTVDDTGAYTVAGLCQAKKAGSSSWEDTCLEGNENKRPRFVVELVAKIEASLH